jgi:hypothetical protein
MTRAFLSAAFLFVFCVTARAQDSVKIWKHAVIASMNIAQVSFTHWAQGGTNSLSYRASINGKSDRNVEMTDWLTSYKLTFGQTKLEGQEILKTDDEINIESMLTYKIGVHINPYAAASLLTQFAPGYSYPDSGGPVRISDFFDPAYLKQSIGMGWKPTVTFQTRLGLALREIITHDFPIYAAEPKQKEFEGGTRIQGGAESVSQLELPVDTNVVLRAKLDLFSPFKSMDRIVMHGETGLIAKISKMFSAELSALFVSDPDLSPFTQIKQGLSIGISYAIL